MWARLVEPQLGSCVPSKPDSRLLGKKRRQNTLGIMKRTTAGEEKTQSDIAILTRQDEGQVATASAGVRLHWRLDSSQPPNSCTSTNRVPEYNPRPSVGWLHSVHIDIAAEWSLFITMMTIIYQRQAQ